MLKVICNFEVYRCRGRGAGKGGEVEAPATTAVPIPFFWSKIFSLNDGIGLLNQM